MLEEKKDEANELLYKVECLYYDAAGCGVKNISTMETFMKTPGLPFLSSVAS